VLTLKTYQQNALDALAAYCRLCIATRDPDLAFYQITREHFHQGIPYHPVAELPGLPYICIRIPTGGGKTLVASHSTGIVAREFLHTDQPLVLWLTPSNTIRSQTLATLRDRRHPYRQALEQYFGAVTVLDVDEARTLQRATLEGGATILVATMQAFRVEETDGRKVYEDSGSLMSHFAGLPEAALAELECFENGQPLRSLANVLRLHRPIVVVDEAHNARTDLSFATLARFRPSCIVEFTATPATGEQKSGNHGSNVLYTVSAAELKAESMIKLPIRLTTHAYWKELLHSAINLRQHLETLAERERLQGGSYLRPIMLLQADKSFQHRETITVDVLAATLRDDFHIPPEQIARATGVDREIDGVDLLSRACPIRFIITVQALREGWDCPFAYVLFSVADMRSGTAVEQLLGRVLRMPYATRRPTPDLNLAYTFSSSTDFASAVHALREALVENGFERQSAGDFITGEAAAPSFADLPLWQAIAAETPQPAAVIVAEAPQLGELPFELATLVRYDPAHHELKFLGERMDAGQMSALQSAFHSADDRTAVQRLFARVNRANDRRTPAQRGVPFAVPLLSIRQGTLIEPFEEIHLLERLPATLQDCPPQLTAAEYQPSVFELRSGVIDIGASGQVRAESFVATLQSHMLLLDADRTWQEADLVRWLDARLPNRADLSLAASQRFLTRLVVNLTGDRSLDLALLVRDRYRLLAAVAKTLGKCREVQREAVFQALLLDAPDGEAQLTVDLAHSLVFDPENYAYNQLYTGAFRFEKHYYPRVADMNGEEADCALWLDHHPAVDFWVRNVERRPESFWLQTYTDKFYPDFVCKLGDGRTLVVEYKSEMLWSTDDSREKRALGALWSKLSAGQCRFVMPKGKDFAAIAAQLQ
jgi:type III restriction enzyme